MMMFSKELTSIPEQELLQADQLPLFSAIRTGQTTSVKRGWWVFVVLEHFYVYAAVVDMGHEVTFAS